MTKQKNSKKNIFIVLFTIFIMFGIAYALNTYQTGYKIPEGEDNSGKNYQIINDLPESYEGKNSCLKVSNYMANNQTTGFFSPTKTKTEWLNFKSWCDTNIDNNTTDNNPNCKIEKKHSGEVFSRVMDGSKHATCAINNKWGGNENSITCWGRNPQGYSSPTPDLGANSNYYLVGNDNFDRTKVKAIYGRCHFGCAIDINGYLKCWFYKSDKTEDADDRYKEDIYPIPNGWDSDLKDLGVGAWHVCGIKKDGSARCWGNQWSRKVKHRYSNDPGSPGSNFILENVPLISTGAKVISIAGSDPGICAAYNNGKVRCRSVSGELDISEPSGLNGVKKIEGASHSFCALKNNGTIKCWGHNDDITSNVPTDSDFIDIQTGQKHACALKSNGTVKCWGEDSYDSYTGIVNGPNGKTNIKALGIGCYHSCLIYNDNNVECWGLNNSNQTNVPSFTPYQGNGLCTEALFE